MNKFIGLGSFPFARRYSGNRIFFLFLRLLRCFSSPGSLCVPMNSVHSRWGLLSGVSPFRDLWVNGYLLLTTAYRSLSRLSSALSAKASALCSFLLDLQNKVLFSLLRASPPVFGYTLFPACCIALHTCSNWLIFVSHCQFLFSDHWHWWNWIKLNSFDIWCLILSFFDMQFSRYILQVDCFISHQAPENFRLLFSGFLVSDRW